MVVCGVFGLIIVAGVFILSSPARLLGALLKVEVPVAHADAIVMMAGDYQSKAPVVAMLYRDRYAPLVMLANDGVFSSWSVQYNRNLHQVEWAEEALVKLGVPRTAIVKLPFYGSGTIYDALTTKRYVLDHNLKSILVVTSDYHTRRTLWSFRTVLKDHPLVIGIYPVTASSVEQDDLKRYLTEAVKLLYYKVRFGLFGSSDSIVAQF
jgi:uncharacterized SAM-binding protein YcdF (DUF218 family)